MSKVGPFLAGAAAGAVIALLYAPRKGEETRLMVSEKVNALCGEAQDWTAGATGKAQTAYQNVSSNASTFAKHASQQAADFAQKGQDAFNTATSRVQGAASQVKPTFTDTSDDLREKIEAARQRIAAQVAKNAEEASSATDPVEVPAEVTDVAEEAKADEDSSLN